VWAEFRRTNEIMIVENNLDDVLGDQFDQYCPMCGSPPIAVVTECGEGTTFHQNENLKVCEHPAPPDGFAVYYIHIVDLAL